MIGEFFINLIFDILTDLLSMLPNVSWNFEESAIGVILDIIATVAYMLPMDTVGSILTIVIALTVFRIVIAIVRTIWDLLPLV